MANPGVLWGLPLSKIDQILFLILNPPLPSSQHPYFITQSAHIFWRGFLKPTQLGLGFPRNPRNPGQNNCVQAGMVRALKKVCSECIKNNFRNVRHDPYRKYFVSKIRSIYLKFSYGATGGTGAGRRQPKELLVASRIRYIMC